MTHQELKNEWLETLKSMEFTVNSTDKNFIGNQFERLSISQLIDLKNLEVNESYTLTHSFGVRVIDFDTRTLSYHHSYTGHETVVFKRIA